MAMDGKELVEKLAKLSQVQSIKDIPQLTHALFPGTHCPLMGCGYGCWWHQGQPDRCGWYG